MNRLFVPALCAVVLSMPIASTALATDAGAVARHQHQRAIEALGQTSGDAPLTRFVNEHLAPEYRESFEPGKLMDLLKSIRGAAAGAGGVLFGADGPASFVRFVREDGETTVLFRMQAGVPYRIVSLELAGAEKPRAGVEPIEWSTLESRLAEEARAGFSGAVLVARDGGLVLYEGYGFADREKKIPNDRRTIFAIGSTPIDFTHAAILKLEDMGKLKTSDLITRHLRDVPADKRAITIEQLMSGRSGLPDFHHVRGVDKDPDLSWIDRGTAVKRILDSELRFEPGTDRAHSHSAWVLLAAIVEMASGQSYGAFLRAHIFEPAGMTRTQLHEDLARVDDREIAIGYDATRAGKVNSPKYWGKTSWLVMGSGGMSSTPDDLYSFFTAVRGARVLSPASAQKFGMGNGLMVGGDDRGFLCMHASRAGDMFILSSNAHSGPGDRAFEVGRRLAEMIDRSR
jgi:CubicO group peptidase (beta-lactamase class C family)